MNGYVGLYRGKRAECFAASSFEAQKKLAVLLAATNRGDVTVILAEKDGKPVVHKPLF